jgi:RNA polymerase sigma-70 factor (ECF subfamily)
VADAAEHPPNRDPDQEALEACRRGDRGAFDVLVERHHRRFFRLAMRLLGDEEAALDAAQDTFLKAWRGLVGFEGGALFTTWLTRIAINQCRNELRRRATLKHGRLSSLDAPGADGQPSAAESLPARELGVADSLQGRELRVAFEAVVQGLDATDREVLILKEVEDLAYEEIAEVLDLPVGTVRSRLHRARAELRRRIVPVL